MNRLHLHNVHDHDASLVRDDHKLGYMHSFAPNFTLLIEFMDSAKDPYAMTVFEIGKWRAKRQQEHNPNYQLAVSQSVAALYEASTLVTVFGGSRRYGPYSIVPLAQRSRPRKTSRPIGSLAPEMI
jgi:Peroxidase, family 2